jgi:hypothetical protein
MNNNISLQALPNKHFILSFLSCIVVWMGLLHHAQSQLTLFLGDNTSGATQNIVNAFNAWTQGANNDMSDLNITTGLTSGGGYAMDTGQSATSAFGNAPSTTTNAPPHTRNYNYGSWSYTVYNTPLANVNTTNWNNPPGTIGAAIYGYGTTGTIAQRLQAAHTNVQNFFSVENPVNQSSITLVVNSTSNTGGSPTLFGFDGQDSGNLGGNNRRDGFTIALSSPISNAGIFLVDMESHSTNAQRRALLAIWDSSGNLIASSTLDFGTTVDSSRGFVGITSTQAFSYISVWVGGTSSSPTAYAYALGGFTFRTAEIPEPTTLVSLGILALLLVGRALFRKSLQAHYVGKAARS